MLDDFQDMINKGLIDVKHVGLTDLQRAVDKLLNIRDYVDLLRTSEPYETDENWWAIRNWLRRN